MKGLNVEPYHAGRTDGQRESTQNKWMSGAINIICATNAFGMGVDKPNVRFVIHHTMPMSLCNFHKESGRGGRDGEISESIMFYQKSDHGKLRGKIQLNE